METLPKQMGSCCRTARTGIVSQMNFITLEVNLFWWKTKLATKKDVQGILLQLSLRELIVKTGKMLKCVAA